MSATLDQCITEHERMMVLQERERCAKIVERVANFRFDGEDRDLVLDIAKEIRNGL
jgi:hypothetical protein